MKHLHTITTVTCPTTGKVYPIPAGGADDVGTGGSGDGEGEGEGDGEGSGSGKAGEGTGAEDGEEQPKKPWGSDEEFDPDKAWRLIQNLRTENSELKPKAARLKELEDADKTEAQKAADRATEAEQRAAKAELEAARAKAALDHGLSADDLELLGAGTADEIAERAKKLAERLGTTKGGQAPPASRGQGRGGSGKLSGADAGRAEAARRFGKRTVETTS